MDQRKRREDSDRLNEQVHKLLEEQPDKEHHTSYGIGGAGNMSMELSSGIPDKKLIILCRAEIRAGGCRGDSQKQPARW